MPRIFKIKLHRHSGIVQTFNWPLFDTTGNFPYYEPANRTDNLQQINTLAMVAYPNVFHGLNFGAPLFVCADSSGTALDNVNHILSYGFDRIHIDQILSDEYFELPNGSTIKLVDITRTSYSYRFTCKYYNAANVQCYPDFQLETTLLTYNTSMFFLPFCADIAGGNYTLLTNQILRVNINVPYFEFTTSGTISPISAALGISFWEGYEPSDPDNPYDDAGESSEGGGDPANQNFDDTSDDVEEDPMPTLSAIGTGMATIFTPTDAQLRSLADVFWGANWWQALQNAVEGIDKMFVSLGIVPFSVTAGSTVEVTWLGLSITEVMLTLAGAQYYEFDMGTINLSSDSRIWRSDSAMDYSPFSKLGIYLPFIGFQELDIDECRGASLQLKYRIDILSGTCVALIKVAGNTIYQFTGNCITQIPITSESFENLFTNAVNVGIAAAKLKTTGAVAGGGDTVTDEMLNRAKKPITKAMADYQHEVHSAQISNARYGLENATANAMMGIKPTYDKTGSVSSSASLFCVKQPYLFLTTPRTCVPAHYQRYAGFPANITDTLGNFEGFTVVNSIRLNDLVATTPEVEEIYELLKSGVII